MRGRDDRADFYLGEAAKVRVLASDAKGAQVRAELLSIAAAFERLAKVIEHPVAHPKR
jgi:hypothetical protein